MSTQNLNILGGAPLVSPAFSGIPTAPLQNAGDSTSALATTAFVTKAITTVQSTIVGINTQIDSYTTILSDAGKLIVMMSSNPITLSIPVSASVPYPVGTVLSVANIGTGVVTISGTSGVSVNSPTGMRITLQYGQASVIKIATDTWLLAGNTSI